MDLDFIHTYILPFLHTPLPSSPERKIEFSGRTYRESRIVHQSLKLDKQIKGKVGEEIVKRCKIPSSYIYYKRNPSFIPTSVSVDLRDQQKKQIPKKQQSVHQKETIQMAVDSSSPKSIAEMMQEKVLNDDRQLHLWKALKISNEWQSQYLKEDIHNYQKSRMVANQQQFDILRYEHQRHLKKIQLNRIILKRL